MAFGVEALLMTTCLKRCDVWRRTSERMGVAEYRYFDARVAADRAQTWDEVYEEPRNNSRLQRRQDYDILCLTNATQCTYNK